MGNAQEAARLQLPGSGGYPDVDNLPVLATLHGICTQLHSLTSEAPVKTFGTGQLTKRGQLLLDSEGKVSGHFVCLRTEETLGSKSYDVALPHGPSTRLQSFTSQDPNNDTLFGGVSFVELELQFLFTDRYGRRQQLLDDNVFINIIIYSM